MNALSFLFVAFVALQIVTFETSAETAETAEIKKPLDSAKQLTEIWQEDNREVLVRNSRGAKDVNGDACRYTKSAWSECDQKTNQRSRTLTLKKGDTSCVQTRTIQKKCKKNKNEKACRYEKGPFSDCQPNGEMTRVDKLKASSDTVNCQQTRTVTKKCNTKSKQEKQPKGNSKDKKQKERKNHQ